MTLLEVTDENYENEVVKCERPVVAYFWAGWCHFCTTMAPRFEQVSAEFKGNVKFCKVDVDKNSKTANRANLKGIPCIIIYKNGKEIGRIVGVEDKNVLIEKIESHLGDYF